MKEEYTEELQKISRVSGILIGLLYALLPLLLIALIFGLYLIYGSSGEDGAGMMNLGSIQLAYEADGSRYSATQSGMMNLGSIQLTAADTRLLSYGGKVFLTLTFLVGIIFTAIFVGCMIKLLNCFRKKMIFSDRSIHFAKLIVWLYTGGMVVSALSVFIIPAVLSIPQGNIKLSFGPIITIGVMWMFVWMLQVGRALQFDSEMAI